LAEINDLLLSDTECEEESGHTVLDEEALMGTVYEQNVEAKQGSKEPTCYRKSIEIPACW